MKIKVSVTWATKPSIYDIDAEVGTVFSVEHPLGEIKFKVADISNNLAIIQTNEPMCKSDGLKINLSETSKRFAWDMTKPLYVATPTRDYGAIVELVRTKEA